MDSYPEKDIRQGILSIIRDQIFNSVDVIERMKAPKSRVKHVIRNIKLGSPRL